MVDAVFGLPLHPLVVHAVVVLLPLVALGVIALVLVPRWRARFAVPLLGLLVVGAVSAVVAMLAGDALAEVVGVPGTHRTWGVTLAFTAVGYLVAAGAWLWWVREPDDEPSRAREALGWLAAVLSMAVVVLTVLAGHSGSSAVWSGVADATPSPAPTMSGEASPSPPSATPSPSVERTDSTATPSRFGSPPATTTTGDGPITMATVEANATADSCWAAIDGFVYDLTDWIARHPGGPDRILALCGTDATAAFTAQHDGDAPPTAQLELLRLGPLA